MTANSRRISVKATCPGGVEWAVYLKKGVWIHSYTEAVFRDTLKLTGINVGFFFGGGGGGDSGVPHGVH